MKKIFSKAEPSKMIKELTKFFKAKKVECEQCGRIHYNVTSDLWKKNQVKYVNRLAKKFPDLHIVHEDSVDLGEISGKKTVVDCKCNFLAFFEKNLLDNKTLISEYFKGLGFPKEKREPHESRDPFG